MDFLGPIKDFFSSALGYDRNADTDILEPIFGHCFCSLNLHHKNYTMMITNVTSFNKKNEIIERSVKNAG